MYPCHRLPISFSRFPAYERRHRVLVLIQNKLPEPPESTGTPDSGECNCCMLTDGHLLAPVPQPPDQLIYRAAALQAAKSRCCR